MTEPRGCSIAAGAAQSHGIDDDELTEAKHDR
jgi:hypothetical protein